MPCHRTAAPCRKSPRGSREDRPGPANENTVIAFSSPVRVAGREVAAGRYGLHMIPGREERTVILSRQANAWGSFAYQSSEDVIRVTTTPVPAELQERLAYTFDGPGADSVVATLR